MSRIIVNTLRIPRNLQNIRSISNVPRNLTKFQKKTFHQRKEVTSFFRRGQHSQSDTKGSGEYVVESPFKCDPIPNQNLVEFLFNDLDEKSMEFDAMVSEQKYYFSKRKLIFCQLNVLVFLTFNN